MFAPFELDLEVWNLEFHSQARTTSTRCVESVPIYTTYF